MGYGLIYSKNIQMHLHNKVSVTNGTVTINDAVAMVMVHHFTLQAQV